MEWGGDVLTGVALVSLGLALMAAAFAWGRWRALVVLALVWTVPLVASDALYFGLHVNLLGYCGEPACDPGPIPASFALIGLPPALVAAATGVALRRRFM